MKNSSTNTFNEGLNFDLNPNVTPDKVLTDNLNGTFLTFNGDELSLQNDAGNTKIPVEGGGFVELTTGFKPLGMKEYGGVLYIVSRKLPTKETQAWVSGTYYNKGAVVYTNNIDQTYYYESLVVNNNKPLPYSSDEYWEVIGTINDFNNKYGEVEFGSYPSPEASGKRPFEGDNISYIESSGKPIFDELYKRTTINTADFKTGRYVVFDNVNSNPDLTNVTTYKNNSLDPKFYKVSLYHQLHNGLLDLTGNIWNSYKTFKGSLNDDYWFIDNTFKYYCPSRYKGKLVLSLEIEELKTFRLNATPAFTLNSDIYNYKLEVFAEGNEVINIPKTRTTLWIDGVLFQSNIETVVTDNVASFTSANVNKDGNEGKLLTYKIEPIIQVGTDLYYPEDLPSEYINKYTLEGSSIITITLDNVRFETVDSNYTCDLSKPGYKTDNEFVIKDVLGNYLNEKLEVTTTPHVFLSAELGLTPDTPDAVIIGTFVVYYGKPRVTTVILPDTNTSLINVFEGKTVFYFDPLSCDSGTGFVPYYLGISTTGVPYIVSTNGDYKTVSLPDTVFSAIGEYDLQIRFAYSSVDKLLFIGENNGYLTIVNIADPDNIEIKRITIATNFTDGGNYRIASVSIANNKIFLGNTRREDNEKNTVFYVIDYKSNIDDYASNVGVKNITFSSTNITGYINNVIYLSGRYWAVTSGGEILRSDPVSNPNTIVFRQIWDGENGDQLIQLGVTSTSNFLWILGKTPDKDMLFFVTKNNLNTTPQLTLGSINGAQNMNVKELIMLPKDSLNQDQLVVLCTGSPGNNIWKIVKESNELLETDFSINSILYPIKEVGGGFYDNNLIHIGCKTDSKNFIATYNITSNIWGAEVLVPTKYSKLFKF